MARPKNAPRFSRSSLPLNNIRLNAGLETDWSDGGLGEFGLAGFNDTRLRAGAREILSIEGRPLLVTGKYGEGRTVAFTGFTPAYTEEHADWDAKVILPYLVDHELYQHPVTKASFHLFMQLVAAATGEKPQVTYVAFLAAREEPLFETLKGLPAAELKMPGFVEAQASGDSARFLLQLTNGDRYARLVRVRAEWKGDPSEAPYLTLYGENYFDLLPGESKTIEGTLLFKKKTGRITGNLIVEGTSVPAKQVAIRLGGGG